HADVLPGERAGDARVAGTGNRDGEGGARAGDSNCRAVSQAVDVSPINATAANAVHQHCWRSSAGIKYETGGSVEDDRSGPDIAAGGFVVDGTCETGVGTAGCVGRDGTSPGRRIDTAHDESGADGAGETSGAGGQYLVR